MPGYWHQWQPYWLLFHKVTFDGENRLIMVNPGVTELDVKQDVYSDWKEWALLDDYSKWVPALRTVGGDPVTDIQSLGGTYFLINGWKMRSWEGDHVLTVEGNLYSDDNLSPFIAVPGWSSQITLKVSNIIDSITNDALASMVWSNSGSFAEGSKADTLDIIQRFVKLLFVK